MEKSKSNEIKIQERMQLLIKNASNSKNCESIVINLSINCLVSLAINVS